MRVLVTSTPGTGHVNPVLPLAGELRRAGHELLWAIAGDGVEEVRRHGYDVVVAGMNLDERRATLEPHFPEIFDRPPRLRRGHLFTGFFARAAAPKMVRELVPVFDRFRPDVVLHEIGELGAAPHAVARGIPHATVAFSGGLPDHAIPMIEEALVPVWAYLRLAAPSMSEAFGEMYFHPFPRSMGQTAAIAQVHEMRPIDVAHVQSDIPEWITSFARERPGIYVTAGTTPIVATLAPWRPTFEALGGLDADVLATIGPRFPVEELGPLPPNVRVERFVPQALVLNRVATVVSHAGAGTMLAAAREAVPQLVIPTWADQWENADAIVRSGSGILLEEHERDTGTILEAVQRLMHDESLRAAARRVATEISEMPSPSDHVTALERLALDRGRRSGL